MDKDTALLTELADNVSMRKRSDDTIAEIIDDLRLRGISWTAIAAVLGVTKQAARQRYAIFNDR